MKVNLKRSELPVLHNQLTANLKSFRGIRLTYAIVKNLKLISSEIEDYRKIAEVSDEYKAYEKKRVMLCADHAELDESGKPVIENDNYKLKDESAFNVEFEKLKEENQALIDARKTQEENFRSFMAEQAEFEFHAIKEADLNDELTGDLVSLILPFIE